MIKEREDIRKSKNRSFMKTSEWKEQSEWMRERKARWRKVKQENEKNKKTWNEIWKIWKIHLIMKEGEEGEVKKCEARQWKKRKVEMK